jgi:hypothetical protein
MSDGLAQSQSCETDVFALANNQVSNIGTQVIFLYAQNACPSGDSNLQPSAL